MEDLNEEQLNDIELFAYQYMLRADISLITGVGIDRLVNPEDPAGIAFLKGRLMRKAKFNGSLIQLTDQLSSPAMQIESKIAENTYLNDLKR